MEPASRSENPSGEERRESEAPHLRRAEQTRASDVDLESLCDVGE